MDLGIRFFFFLHIRSEKEVFMNGVVFPPELTRRVRGFYDVKSLLEDIGEQFPGMED